MPLTHVAAWGRGDDKRALSIGLQFSSLPLKSEVFPKLKRAVWAHTKPGLPAPICARNPPKSGVTQEEQWEGTGFTIPRQCLSLDTFPGFSPCQRGGKAKPGQQWLAEKAGKSSCGSHPVGLGQGASPIPTHPVWWPCSPGSQPGLAAALHRGGRIKEQAVTHSVWFTARHCSQMC